MRQGVGTDRPRVHLMEDGRHRVAMLEDLELLLAEAVGGHLLRGVAPVVHQIGQVLPDDGVLHQIAGQCHLDVTNRLSVRGHRRMAGLPIPLGAQFVAERCRRRPGGRGGRDGHRQRARGQDAARRSACRCASWPGSGEFHFACAPLPVDLLHRHLDAAAVDPRIGNGGIGHRLVDEQQHHDLVLARPTARPTPPQRRAPMPCCR